VIPVTELELDWDLPDGWNYWIPDRDAANSDEGFGAFRNTWIIRKVKVNEAKEVLVAESELVGLADSLARDELEFDELAVALEHEDSTSLPDRFSRPEFDDLLGSYLDRDDFKILGGLEMGVAGLVNALAMVGCWPAASCRGHASQHAWAAHPVVYVAADQHRTDALLPLVQDAGCGITVDSERPDLLAIVAPSIVNTMALGENVMIGRKAFRRPRQATSAPPPRQGFQQSFEWG
jgi:hypothetical protein